MGRDFNANDVAKLIFKCVSELKIRYGINYIAAVLIGSKLQKITNKNHDQLSTFGSLKDYSFEQVKEFIAELLENDFLFQTRDQYPVLFLLDKGKQVLAGNISAELKEPNPGLGRKFGVPGESMEKTVALFKEGKSVKEIARERGLSPETVISHLAFGYQRGEPINIDQFVPAHKQELIVQAFQKLGTDYLTPIKQSLSVQCSWEELKLVRAKLLRQNSVIIN